MKAELMRQQEEEVARERNFVTLLQTAQQSLIPNQEEFDCGICFVPVEPGEGVVLRECLHRFCRLAFFNVTPVYTNVCVILWGTGDDCVLQNFI